MKPFWLSGFFSLQCTFPPSTLPNGFRSGARHADYRHPMRTHLKLAVLALLVVALSAPAAETTEPEVFQVVRKRNTRQLASMLDAGAAAVLKARGQGGSSLLHLAAAQDDTEALQLLIARGAVIDQQTDNGATPLHWAANCNAAAAARLLVENGANVNARTARDFSPLHWAALGNATNVIGILLERGAALYSRNDEGRTALDLAVDSGKEQSAAMLRAAQIVPLRSAQSRRQADAEPQARPWWAFWRSDRQTTARASPLPAKEREPVAPTNAAARAPAPAPAPKSATAAIPAADMPAGAQVQIITFRDGSAYEGSLQGDVFHGFGTLMSASGDMYRGNWNAGERHGTGEYTFADGERYKGEWAKGRMWGKGTYTFASGDRMEGTWQNNGLVKGEGSYHFSNGDFYSGEWQRDRPWGKGSYMCADGRRFAGYFINGRFVGSERPDDGQPLAAEPKARGPSPR